MANPRIAAVSALIRVERDKGYSNIVLNSILKLSAMSARDSAMTSAIFYGVLERAITLDYVINKYSKTQTNKMQISVKSILRAALYQILYMDKIPYSAAVNEAVAMTRDFSVKSASGLINAVLRAFLRDGAHIDYPQERLQYLSIYHSCPEWMIKMWIKAYGEENTVRMMNSLPGRPPLTVRVNTQKTTAEELTELLSKQGIVCTALPWLENALVLENTGSVESIDEFEQGLFHVQDAASQLCCQLLGMREGETVYDVCAAPGGKTFTVAQHMNGKGRVKSFDLYEHKVKLINDGAKRLGLDNVSAFVRDAENPEIALEQADRILCDVPCSGLGIIRRKPEIRNKLQIELAGLPALQYKILCESSKLLKSGGTLIYSTCTLVAAENGSVTRKFLREHEDFEQVELNLPEGVRNADEMPYEVTLLPGVLNTDGFYIAAFCKK